ncbi:MAG: CAP domain-containing protein [Candidatus Gracilibacteria bacterium]
MKKYFLIIVFLLFIKVDAFATDACDRLVPQYANFVGKVVMGSNLRDYPCISKSNVLGVSIVGDNYTVISKVDGWYQVKLDDSKIYRIRDKAIEKTNNTVTYQSVKEEPVQTIKKVETVEYNGYQLVRADSLIINKLLYKVNKVIQVKGLLYRDSLVSKLSKVLVDGNYSARLIAILYDIKNKIAKIEILSEKKTIINNINNGENIDMNRVRDVWLGRFNTVRNDLGKHSYSYDSKLEKTALEWSQISKDRGDITHKRDLSDSYYDYSKITSWFKDRGVVCKNIGGTTNTENIGYGTFSCKDSECTDELISGIRSTFDFYMGEKYKSYQPHYQSIINTNFTKMGIGIELQEKSNGYYKFYLTVHYCTKLVD